MNGSNPPRFSKAVAAFPLNVMFATIWLMATLGGWSNSSTRAEEWFQISMPSNAKDNAGFSLSLTTIGPQWAGYLPVQWKAVASNGTFPGDRTLQLNWQADSFGNFPITAASYSTAIVLPSGKASAAGTFYLPKYFEGFRMRVSVSDASGPLIGYATGFQSDPPPLATEGMSLSGVIPRIGLIIPEVNPNSTPASSLVPDLRTLDSLVFPDEAFLAASNPVRLTALESLTHSRLNSFSTAQILTPATAHDDWRGYESVEILIIPFSILQELKSGPSQKMAAIRQWISCGGVLWTYGVPSRVTLGEFFDKSIPTEPTASEQERVEKSETKRSLASDFPTSAWPFNEIKRGMTVGESDLLLTTPEELTAKLQTLNHPMIQETSLAELQTQIVRLPLEAGIVIGMLNDDPFPGSHQYWHTVKYLSGRNQVWKFRRSTTPMLGSSNYWTWLLDNVARPPVYAFLTLLTFFVFLVGPVSYYWTRSIGRSYLMFVIAPILAALTTIAMFAYGLVADGLGAKARIRQITWVDAATERASRTTRSTYFTAFRQPAGLQFLGDIAVYPMADPELAWNDFYSRSTARDRRIAVTPDRQILQGDFLPSRTQRQFLGFQPVAGSTSLKSTASTQDSLTLQSNFDVRIQTLILRDQDQNYWINTAPCQPGQSLITQPIAKDNVGKILRELYMNEQPQAPPGYSSNNGRRYGYLYNIQNYTTQHSRSWAHPNDELGIYEATLREMLLDTGELPTGWFVATADISNNASAIESAELVHSIHYFMGTWQ